MIQVVSLKRYNLFPTLKLILGCHRLKNDDKLEMSFETMTGNTGHRLILTGNGTTLPTK
jgi:hypothetical protein